tara:strand:- start:81 stop:239 length:159 start_codon:yes stop_codon:yes gene_type:complete
VERDNVEEDKVSTHPGFCGEAEIIVASASKVVARFLHVVTAEGSRAAQALIT